MVDPVAMFCRLLSKKHGVNLNPGAIRDLLVENGLTITGGARAIAEDHLQSHAALHLPPANG